MATSAYRQAVIDDTPVFYTSLDETAAPEIEKKSGASITAVNAPTPPTDFDDGWTFNGTDEYLIVDAADLDQVAGWIAANQSFSIECWIKQNNGWSGDNVRKVLRWGAYGLFLHVYGFPAQADAYMVAGFYDDLASEKTVEEYGAWLDNSWHHVVVTFDRPDLKLYIDGNLVQSETRDFDIHITENGGEQFAIGRNGPFSDGYFPGSIDDVALYNYALTETRIDAHFVASKVSTAGTDDTIGTPPGLPPRTPPEGVASSFHAGWTTDFDTDGLVKEVLVDLRILKEPTVTDIYFWALQASFYGATGLLDPLAGCPTPLQWTEDHPDSKAVHFGVYDELDDILTGTESSFPSAPANDNTRGYGWVLGEVYTFRIWISGTDLVAASINGDLIRQLDVPGVTWLHAYAMWSEVFAECSAPGVVCSWSNFRVIDDTDAEFTEDTFDLTYQVTDGCPNTDTYEYGNSVRQETNTTRTNP